MNPLENYDRAAAAVTKIINAVRSEQLGLPTACTDWDVRAVINHLVHGNAKFASWANGGAEPEQGDYLGEDFHATFEQSVRDMRKELAQPGLFERMVQTPLGTAPGVLLVHMRVNEYLVHGWDIADATGQPTDFEPEFAEQALADWQKRFGNTPRPPGGSFGPELAAGEGASAADRLAAFLGREKR
jgi:uncharacterized protein (TIGR03086 family)